MPSLPIQFFPLLLLRFADVIASPAPSPANAHFPNPSVYSTEVYDLAGIKPATISAAVALSPTFLPDALPASKKLSSLWDLVSFDKPDRDDIQIIDYSHRSGLLQQVREVV